MMHKHYGRGLLGLLLLMLGVVHADEIRPGYLQLRETGPNAFAVLWKVPLKGDMKLRLEPRLPATCANKTSPASTRTPGALIQRWVMVCRDGLVGQRISIAGLEHTITDVLLRMERLDGSAQTVRLTPRSTGFDVPRDASATQIVRTYLWLGVEHILMGIDHLLFVFALMLLVNNWRRLLATITAFTLAHSITLAGATLGLISLPQQLVEALIALSILFLAAEIVHSRRGQPSSVEQRPWLVAFAFGLLHGFGFAGALSEIGLPQQAIPLALVFFNVGVELGQIVFVAVILALGWGVRQIRIIPLSRAQLAMSYGVGSIAAFWTIQRVAGFWG